MPYAIGIYFSNNSEKSITKFRTQLVNHNIISHYFENYHSHLTFAIFENLDLKNTGNALKKFLKKNKIPDIELETLEFFDTKKNVAYIDVYKTKELADLHLKIFTTIEKFGEHPRKEYLPKNWHPHITIALDFDIKAKKVIKCMYSKVVITPVLIPVQIAIVEFFPAKDRVKFNI